jgi:predicted nucleic acid-binding protein
VTEATASNLVLVDSSGWLEYITADTKAELFIPYFKNHSSLLVPSLVIYEVRKVLMRRGASTVADLFVSEVVRHQLVSIDHEIALRAALLSIDYKLHMADALIYAVASDYKAQVVTTDSHFKDLPGVTIL